MDFVWRKQMGVSPNEWRVTPAHVVNQDFDFMEMETAYQLKYRPKA